jgi:hypothetical protein
MDKPKLNFVIDAAMFLCLMAMAGLGFLIKYFLPSGRDAWATYGSNLQFSWLGWDRHDWGDLHLYLAFTLLTLLVLHIILHWRQILGLFHRVVPDPRRRYRIALVFLILSLLLIYFPFLITPESKARGRGGRRSQGGGAEGRAAVQGPAGGDTLTLTAKPAAPEAAGGPDQVDRRGITFPILPWSYDKESPGRGKFSQERLAS